MSRKHRIVLWWILFLLWNIGSLRIVAKTFKSTIDRVAEKLRISKPKTTKRVILFSFSSSIFVCVFSSVCIRLKYTAYHSIFGPLLGTPVQASMLKDKFYFVEHTFIVNLSFVQDPLPNCEYLYLWDAIIETNKSERKKNPTDTEREREWNWKAQYEKRDKNWMEDTIKNASIWKLKTTEQTMTNCLNNTNKKQ